MNKSKRGLWEGPADVSSPSGHRAESRLGSLQPHSCCHWEFAAHNELDSVNCPLSRLGRTFACKEPETFSASQMPALQMPALQPVRLSQRVQVNHAQIPTPQKLWHDVFCLNMRNYNT